MALVSIIIPVYNGEKFIAAAIDSVLAQSYKDFEIIVANDGSTDNTAAVVSSYRDNIKYYYQPHKGVAAARNLGIKKANGLLIAFLDADDIWLPNKLEVQIKFMNEHPEFAVSYTDRMTIDEKGHYLKRTQDWNCPSGDIFEKQFMANYIATPTVMCYRKCFDKAGYFDESPEMRGAEDYNMWLRLAHYYQFGYIDIPLTKVRFHSKGTSRRGEWLYQGDIYTIRQAVKLFGSERPSVKTLTKKRLSQINYNYGLCAFYEGDYKLARKVMARALMYRPLNTKIWPRFLISFLPLPLINMLKAIKKTYFKLGPAE